MHQEIAFKALSTEKSELEENQLLHHNVRKTVCNVLGVVFKIHPQSLSLCKSWILVHFLGGYNLWFESGKCVCYYL